MQGVGGERRAKEWEESAGKIGCEWCGVRVRALERAGSAGGGGREIRRRAQPGGAGRGCDEVTRIRASGGVRRGAAGGHLLL